MTVETPEKPVILDEPEALLEREPLRPVDRCDYCGAQAFVVVAFESTAQVDHPGELLFCGHDFAKHEARLGEFVIRDEREKLLMPSVSGY